MAEPTSDEKKLMIEVRFKGPVDEPGGGARAWLWTPGEKQLDDAQWERAKSAIEHVIETEETARVRRRTSSASLRTADG